MKIKIQQHVRRRGKLQSVKEFGRRNKKNTDLACIPPRKIEQRALKAKE